MVEELVRSMSKWPHPEGLAAYVKNLMSLSKLESYHDVIKFALEAAWRDAEDSPMISARIKRAPLSHPMFEQAMYYESPPDIQKADKSNNKEFMANLGKITPQFNDAEKQLTLQGDGNIIDVNTKVIALPDFFGDNGLFETLADGCDLQIFETEAVRLAIRFYWESF